MGLKAIFGKSDAIPESASLERHKNNSYGSSFVDFFAFIME
jgi:hypothetical protein